MSRSISRAHAALAVLLASTLLALATLLCTAPAAQADEISALSQKIASSLVGESETLSQRISTALTDGIASAKREAFVDESRAGDFYFAQNGSGRCTITSVAMMVRRAAYLDDNPDWASIGRSSVSADGWTSAGVKWSFETSGYEIGIIDVDGTTESLRDLLEEHPEGIAAYDPNVPHAVLLTDYDEESGTFYCADPANYKAGSRIPLADSWNGECRGGSQSAVVSGISRAWIIRK
ncbi:MAG: hypothetical protein V8R08_07770 [Coriobacteriales bacterium]